eukprot:c38491_g1_i1 orf=486-842(+)
MALEDMPLQFLEIEGPSCIEISSLWESYQMPGSNKAKDIGKDEVVQDNDPTIYIFLLSFALFRDLQLERFLSLVESSSFTQFVREKPSFNNIRVCAVGLHPSDIICLLLRLLPNPAES